MIQRFAIQGCPILTLCLSPLLTTPFIHMAFLLKSALLLLAHQLEVCASIGSHVRYAQDKLAYNLKATPDTLHFRCSYCLNPSHPFLPTWGVVMLDK